jgi:hypothetical protein
VSTRLKIEKISPFQLGLHHFNPPPKAISYKRYNEVFHQREKSLGAEQCVRTLKDKGMKTQYEVKIFSIISLLSKVEFSPLPRFGYGLIYILQMELKGRVKMFPVHGRSRIMDLMT